MTTGFSSLEGTTVRRIAALSIAVATWFFASLAMAAETPIPPAPTAWVTDTANLMSPGARATLDARLKSYESDTGHQVVVWIGDTIGTSPLDDFAVRTFQAWRIGKKGHDDGLLMVVLARDRKIDIEVGYGLEARVPDVTAGRIINDVMAPRLKAGDADAAITDGVGSVLSAIEGHAVAAGEPRAPPAGNAAPHPRGHPWLFGIFGLIFLALLITHPTLATYFLFSIMNGGGGFGGGGLGGGGGFSGGGGRSGGGGARGSW